MNRRAALFTSLLALFLSTAAGTPWHAYHRAWQAETRDLKLYRGFGTALLLTGTLLTPDFRSDLAAERARLLDSPPEDVATFAKRMKEDGAKWHEVVFAAESPLQEGPLVFGSSDAGWQVRLTADGQAEKLVAVEQVDDPTPLHEALYPQIDQWSSVWIARFERTVADPDTVVFEVASGFGHGRLVWRGLRH